MCCALFHLALLVPWFHFCPSHSCFLWMGFPFFPLDKKNEFSSWCGCIWRRVVGVDAAPEKKAMGDVVLWVRPSMLLHCARQGTLSGFDRDVVSVSLPQQVLESISSFPLHLLYFLLFSISSSYTSVSLSSIFHLFTFLFLSMFWHTLFFHPFLLPYTTFRSPHFSSYSSAL